MTPTATTPAPFPTGTLVRATRDIADLDPWCGHHRKGDVFTVEEFWPAGDPEADEIDVDFYVCSNRNGLNNVTVPADAVELHMTATTAQARRLPSSTDFASFLGSVACTEHDGLDVEETEQNPDGEGTVALIGTAKNGLRFYIVVAVLRVEECDF